MRILAIAIRIVQQFFRDKRSLALIFVVPLVILWIFSLALTNGTKDISLGYVNLPSPMIEALEESDIPMTQYSSLDEAEEALINSDIDAYLNFDGGTLDLRLEGSDLTTNTAVMKAINEASSQNSLVQMNISYLYGEKDLDTFDTIGPIFLGFFAFFFVFLLSGISFVRERITGTLERILVSPVRRMEIVLGYVLGFSIFAIIQSALITFFTVHILHSYNVGSFINVLIVTVILSLSALTLGTFLSAFAHNEFQVIQFIPIVIVPQVFFSGLLPIDKLPTWLNVLGKLYPLTYGAEVLRNVMFKGQGLGENIINIVILLSFSIVFIVLNMYALKKQRVS